MIVRNPRGRYRRASLLLISSVFIAAPTSAGNNGPMFSCWDGTFAYTTVGVNVSPDRFQVRIASQDETIFQPILSVHGLDWGQAILDIWFETEACSIDGSDHTLSCLSTPISATFQFGGLPNDERQTVNPHFGELRVELLPSVTPGLESDRVTGRTLFVGQRNQSDTESMVIDFSQHHDCSGWPDPFSLD